VPQALPTSVVAKLPQNGCLGGTSDDGSENIEPDLEIAREIVELLHLCDDDVPDWVRACQARLGELMGERQPGDGAEICSPTGSPVESKDGTTPPDPAPFDGEAPSAA